MENENKVIPTTNNAEFSENEVVQGQEFAKMNSFSESKAEEKRCPNCQALLTEEQNFCPECGTSYRKLCPNCKTEIQNGQVFCPSCGQKIEAIVSNVNGDIALFNANIEKQKSKKKLLPIILGAVGVCVVAIYFIFTVFMNPQHYIEKGDYQKAYEVASGEQKENVLRENIVAVVSADCVESLKDSSSFELRDVWIRFNDESRVIIMKVAANNSYGNLVINYWYYSYDNEEKKYSLFASFSDFDEEKTYSWDDTDEKIEKLLDNLAKSTAQSVMSDGLKINDDSIDNINKLFEKDILEDVVLLDAEPQKTK